MHRLIPVKTVEDIFSEHKNTPIGKLLEYQNLKRKHDFYETAEILIGMCMDSRKRLRIPDNFAMVIRSGGANLRYSEFKISYSISIGNISHLALIGHNNCRMVNLFSRKDEFVNGLVKKAGWTKEKAEDHFMQFAPMFEIGNEIDFVVSEAKRLRHNYPKIQIAPLMYSLEDNLLSQIKE